MRPSLALALALVLGACGGAATPPDAPAPDSTPAPEAPTTPEAAGEAEPAAEAADDKRVPQTCETDPKSNLCLPPPPFVKALCSGFHPSVALAYFAKGTPFSRAYLKGDVEAWNASGGASSNDKLVFDEEVLVLSYRPADTGGMQVSGAAGSYDVLRWDGTCATLSTEEVTTKPAPKPKTPKIPWKNLDDATQEALAKDEKVGKALAARRKECKGVTMGDVSLACVKADDAVSAAVVAYLRGGGEVPLPERLP